MKKFIALALLISSVEVMATAPVALPNVEANVPKISFEDGENSKWSIEGTTNQIVTENGVSDGAKAFQVNVDTTMPEFEKSTKLSIVPPAGGTWNLLKTDKIKTSLTNPNNFDIVLRIVLVDTIDTPYA